VELSFLMPERSKFFNWNDIGASGCVKAGLG